MQGHRNQSIPVTNGLQRKAVKLLRLEEFVTKLFKGFLSVFIAVVTYLGSFS